MERVWEGDAIILWREESRGQVIGVIPSYFNTQRLAQSGLTRLEVVEIIHQRKVRMAELVEAFIALPGGLGTLEELFEILTWVQIGLHQKPIHKGWNAGLNGKNNLALPAGTLNN